MNLFKLFFALIFLTLFGCSLSEEVTTILPTDPDNGTPISGTWTGTWFFSTADGELACEDLKTFVFTQTRNSFTGSASFVAQQPIQTDCDANGTFTIQTGSIDSLNITMTWDFGGNVIAIATGVINEELTVMTLSATETVNGVLDGGGDITLTKQ
jgi:hypothetical protein